MPSEDGEVTPERTAFPAPESVALYWWRTDLNDPWHLTLWADVPEDIEDTRDLAGCDFIPAQTLSETLEGLAVELDARAEELDASAERKAEMEGGQVAAVQTRGAANGIREAASLLQTRAQGER